MLVQVTHAPCRKYLAAIRVVFSQDVINVLILLWKLARKGHNHSGHLGVLSALQKEKVTQL